MLIHAQFFRRENEQTGIDLQAKTLLNGELRPISLAHEAITQWSSCVGCYFDGLGQENRTARDGMAPAVDTAVPAMAGNQGSMGEGLSWVP